ncbi:MAG: alpha/beta hydrolase [bacterium]
MTDVILIHGLSGSAADMEYIADNLSNAGYRTFSVNLPGHGTDPGDLLHINMQNWVDAVESRINACTDKIFIIGLSMGALLALYCTVMHQDRIKGIILLSPAIRLYGRLNRLFMSMLYIFSRFLPIPHIYYKKTKGPDIADQLVKRDYNAYNKIPLKALIEFERLRRATIKRLGMINVPVLMIYSKHDHTIDNNAVEIIDKKISSTIKEKRMLPNSFHVISIDVEKRIVVDNILKFQRFIELGVK